MVNYKDREISNLILSPGWPQVIPGRKGFCRLAVNIKEWRWDRREGSDQRVYTKRSGLQGMEVGWNKGLQQSGCSRIQISL